MDQIISRTSMDEDEDAASATLLWREVVVGDNVSDRWLTEEERARGRRCGERMKRG
jgi:hypothetical protein